MSTKGYILAINPGSTSTKLSIFKDEHCVITSNLTHSSDEIKKFEKIYDQKDMRTHLILQWLEKEGIALEDLIAVVGRGGLLRPMPGGTYEITPKMLEDLKIGYQAEHASNLGGVIAFEIARKINIPSFMVGAGRSVFARGHAGVVRARRRARVEESSARARRAACDRRGRASARHAPRVPHRALVRGRAHARAARRAGVRRRAFPGLRARGAAESLAVRGGRAPLSHARAERRSELSRGRARRRARGPARLAGGRADLTCRPHVALCAGTERGVRAHVLSNRSLGLLTTFARKQPCMTAAITVRTAALISRKFWSRPSTSSRRPSKPPKRTRRSGANTKR